MLLSPVVAAPPNAVFPIPTLLFPVNVTAPAASPIYVEPEAVVKLAPAS